MKPKAPAALHPAAASATPSSKPATPRSRDSIFELCSCLILITTLFVVLVICVLDDSPPDFVLPEFAVTSARVSHFNLSSPTSRLLSADFAFTLSVTNPNKAIPASYDGHVEATLVIGGDDFAMASLPPLATAAPGSTAALSLRFPGSPQYVAGAKAVAEGRRSRGRLGVGLVLLVPVRPGPPNSGNSTYDVEFGPMRVTCDGLWLTFAKGAATEGSMDVAAPKRCNSTIADD